MLQRCNIDFPSTPDGSIDPDDLSRPCGTCFATPCGGLKNDCKIN
jgi:hypothetical protein